jgi:competence protein ComEC
MRARHDLPRLFVAALSVAAGAIVPISGPVAGAPLCALLGIGTLLAGEAGLFLLPFILAGHAARPAPPRPPGEPRASGAIVRTLEPAIETADGRARQLAELAPTAARAGPDGERETAGTLTLPSAALALPRGWLARAHGQFREACSSPNPGGSPLGADLTIASRLALEPIGDDASPRERLLRAIDRLAAAIERTFRARFDARTAAFAEAVVLGRTARLDPELIASLRASGAWHLLAVSGSHVALVAACTARALAPLPLPPLCELLATLAATLGFSLLTGAQAPAMRAAITFAGALPLLRGRRPAAPLAWLGAAFLLIVAGDPGAADDAGTQLSFTAVLALSVAARHGPARSPRGSGRGLDFAGAFGRTLRFAVAAGLATAPLCAWHFGSAAPWAPLATLLLAPPVSLAIVTGLVAAGVVAAVPAAAPPFAFVLGQLDAAVSGIAKALDRLPLTPWPLPAPAGVAVLLLFAVWIALVARRGGLAALLALAAIVVGDVRGTPPSRAVALAAGHGLACVVQESDQSVLLDCGGFGTLPAAATRIARPLHALDVERLEALFLSHLDGDHAGLAPALLERLEVGRLVVAPPAAEEIARADSPIGALLGRALALARRPLARCTAGMSAAGATILWPPAGRRFAERNSGCLALTCRIGSLTLLAPGDLEGYPLAELALARPPPADVLLLPHHGNVDPALGALLDAVAPRFAIASRDNPLPAATCEALRLRKIPWLSTARGGAIAIADPGPPGRGCTILRGAAAADSDGCFLGAPGR